MTAKEKFIEMSKDITRPGIDRLMAWLETTDFYEAPASTRFHSAEPGGLCAHSVAVAKATVGDCRPVGSRSVYPRHIADGGAVPRPVQSFHLYGEYAQC